MSPFPDIAALQALRRHPRLRPAQRARCRHPAQACAGIFGSRRTWTCSARWAAGGVRIRLRGRGGSSARPWRA